MSNPQLRLTVYRESVGPTRLRWPCGGTEETSPLPQRAEAGEWSEAIYSWVLGGEDQVVSALSSELAQKFSEGMAPVRRRPAYLRDLALSMRDAVSKEWSASSESLDADGEELAPAMVNASAALIEHLHWVAETFAHLPGAHIVVR
jgi:hypothetical protein